MDVDVPYDTQTRRITVPDWTRVIRSRQVPALADARSAFVNALAAPIAAPPLHAVIHATDRVAIAISDITRPTPNHLLVPWLLAALAHVPREQLVILIGNGSHRAMTQEELVQMLGADIVASAPIINHDATDAAALTYLGETPSRVPVWVNRAYVEADVRIVVGFIEPHFFASFSGGPKGAIPGLAGLATIQALHSAVLIDDPRSTS